MSGRTMLVLAAAALLVAGGAGAYLWWPRGPAVPSVPLDGLDAEVAEAIRSARARAEQEPRSAAAWGLLGRVLMANELHQDVSLACFEEAARLDPKDARWPYYRGALLAGRGKAAEALPLLERAAALCERAADGNPAPGLLLAETLAALERPDAAEKQFREALAADPQSPRANFGLALLAYARADWPRCRTHLEACLGSPQSRKRASGQLAAVCERLGDPEAARKHADAAARLPKDADWFDAYLAENVQLAKAKRDWYRAVEGLEAAGRFAQAAELLKQMTAKHPDDHLPHLMLGRILPQVGQFEPAERHLQKALALAPDKIQVHYLLGLVYLKQGEALAGTKGDPEKAKSLFRDAERHARAVLARKPDYGFAHMALGLSLKHLGRGEEAAASLRQAVHCNPEYAENHLMLGEALAEAGDSAGARPHLERARLLAGPNDPRPAAALKRLDDKNGPKKG